MPRAIISLRLSHGRQTPKPDIIGRVDEFLARLPAGTPASSAYSPSQGHLSKRPATPTRFRFRHTPYITDCRLFDSLTIDAAA